MYSNHNLDDAENAHRAQTAAEPNHPMSTGDQTPRFSPAMRALHWKTAAILFGSYPAAWMITRGGSITETAWLLMLHRSCGVTILLIALLRLALRQRARIPPPPPGMPWPLRAAARAGVTALYVLLIVQPLLGLIGSMLYGDHIILFGVIAVPFHPPANRPLARQIFHVQAVVSVALLAMIAVHVAAALYHHFVRRDDVMAGMLPSIRYLPRAHRLTGWTSDRAGRRA